MPTPDQFLSDSAYWYAWAGVALLALTFGFNGAPLLLWTLLGAVGLWLVEAPVPVCVALGAAAVVFNVPAIRSALVSSIVMRVLKGIMPQISETERTALSAGDVWVEGELFSGKPNLKRLVTEPTPKLTAEERAFIDGPVERLCAMVTDYEIWQRRELPKEAWDHIKRERFLGMIIPKEYGGHGFSAFAHSEVLAKLGSRSIPLCISVMVPNSLGPAELLIHYGTDAQKKHYLPRLARGEEIPCFALTEPSAGSDAASIQASGVVFKGDDGKLYLKLNWNKRWITLAAISTTLGLAFRLRDPDNLLGKGVEPGITCALIPTATPGVVANRRHDPLGVPFFNCPTQGKDVVVPIDAIIGGVEYSGKGWRMLMECLAAGRGISLPAQAGGGVKAVTRFTSAFAVVRKQFGVSIGKFEGVAEPLARLAGYSYLLESARLYTCGALDGGKKPPVVTAIAKYNFTEIARKVVNDAMDILGGAGISRGPRNLIANAYISAPISITVEGANILTRTLIIFGQGALRAHPYAFKEVDAIDRNDLRAFDAAFFGHVGHVVRNSFRSVLLSLTRGYLTITPTGGVSARYWRRLNWASASFAIMADVAMAVLGGSLKFREKVTGRFADILSWMYLASATLHRFEADGRLKEDEPHLHWAMHTAFARIQEGFDGIFGNFRMPLLGWFFQGPLRWYSSLNPIGTPPSDRRDLELAELTLRAGPQRERLYGGTYLPKDPEDQLAKLEQAFQITLESEEVAHRVRKAVRKGKLKKKAPAELYADAVAANIITAAEAESVGRAERLRWDVIQVDDYGLPEYLAHGGHAPGGSGGPALGGSSATPTGVTSLGRAASSPAAH